MDLSQIKSLLGKLKQFLGSKWGLVFKIGVSIAILTFFFMSIDVERFMETLQSVRYEYVALIIGFIVLRNLISGWRFQVLCTLYEKISVWILTKHYFIGAMFNMFLPTTIGGDGVRVFLAEKEGIKKKDGLVLVLVERFVGFFSFVIFAFIGSFLLLSSLPWKIHFVVWGITVAYTILFSLVFSDFFSIDKIPIVNRLSRSFNEIKKNKRILFNAFLISILYQFVSIYLRYMIALAFGIEISFLPFLVFIPLINLVTLLPISFGGLGLREIAFVYTFSNIGGLSEESALVLSIGSYIMLIINALMGAVLFFYDNIILNIKYQFNKNEVEA